MPIELINVGFSYNENIILDKFNFELPDSGTVCLQGRSGCGKTTLLRLIAGLERPQSGEIKGIEGAKKAIVFQENRLLPWRTALDNVAVVTKMENGHLQAAEWLERFGLSGQIHKRPSELSGGMKRRVAIARALVIPADILIMDEPFVGLDDELVLSITKEIMSLYSQKLIVMVSHSKKQAQGLSPITYNFEGPPLRLIDNSTL